MTVKFTKIIYILILVLVGISLIIGWLVPAFTIMATGVALIGVLWLLIGWIIPVIQLVLFRVVLELFIATIRTAQNTAGTRQEIQKLRDEVGQRG
ncbi:cytochrome b subunit of formate dehydrogenase [Auritidibacter ignavus]|nr:cytochrome b subunit of formate dehydrogenase [Auritidibacter ignavus]